MTVSVKKALVTSVMVTVSVDANGRGSKTLREGPISVMLTLDSARIRLTMSWLDQQASRRRR